MVASNVYHTEDTPPPPSACIVAALPYSCGASQNLSVVFNLQTAALIELLEKSIAIILGLLPNIIMLNTQDMCKILSCASKMYD